MFKLISPTGLGQKEYDPIAGGYFRAKRKDGEWHDGMDLLCEPGQTVIAPVDGVVTRVLSDDIFSGLILDAGQAVITLFYVELYPTLVGCRVLASTPLGTAQDVRDRFGPLAIPYVHMSVTLSPNQWLEKEGKILINPRLLLEV